MDSRQPRTLESVRDPDRSESDRVFRHARGRAWEAGRTRYGPEWSGLHPAYEAYAELVDCANYVAEWRRRGEITQSECEQLLELTELLARAIARLSPDEGEPVELSPPH